MYEKLIDLLLPELRCCGAAPRSCDPACLRHRLTWSDLYLPATHLTAALRVGPNEKGR